MTAGTTFVVADIHGRLDLLELALERISSAAPSNRGARTVVFTGDYIDRGPQSRQVIERLMAGPPAGWRWVCLKGNHEDMLVVTCGGHVGPDWWIDNGGCATLRSYGARGTDRDAILAAIPAEHVRWATELPTLHQDRHRIFVHAGVDPALPLDRQGDDIRLWMRNECPLGHGNHHVVHGHTPHRDGPRVTAGRTNLDTGAFFTGRLVVAVFDDELAGAPVRFIEVRANP